MIFTSKYSNNNNINNNNNDNDDGNSPNSKDAIKMASGLDFDNNNYNQTAVLNALRYVNNMKTANRVKKIPLIKKKRIINTKNKIKKTKSDDSLDIAAIIAK